MKGTTSGSEIDTSSLVKRIMGYTKPSEDILALQHGRKHEETARGVYASNAFTKHDNFSVKQTGLHVSRELPFLGSTPDGIVSCGCCGSGILEIKCPFSVYGQTPTPKNLSYLTNEDDQVKLRKSHQYYTQVQMQMGVTGSKWCDFFIYTGADVDSHEERIALMRSDGLKLLNPVPDSSRTTSLLNWSQKKSRCHNHQHHQHQPVNHQQHQVSQLLHSPHLHSHRKKTNLAKRRKREGLKQHHCMYVEAARGNAKTLLI